MYACNRPVKMLNSIIGTGTKSGMMINRTLMTISSPMMLPNSRKVSEKVRAISLATSMGSIKKIGST